MEKIDILEQKISNILETVETLRLDNEGLTLKLREREDEIRGLKQEMDNLLGERAQVIDKVENLIKNVEEF